MTRDEKRILDSMNQEQKQLFEGQRQLFEVLNFRHKSALIKIENLTKQNFLQTLYLERYKGEVEAYRDLIGLNDKTEKEQVHLTVVR